MNAVIVDIQKKHAAALDESGRVVRIHNAGYEIGQTIELHEVKPVRTPTMFKRLSTGVAAAVLVAMIGTGTAYAMPYGTVTLDGDSSVEYTINCFDYVLNVKGTNEKGEALLAEIDTRQLRHHRIDAAVATTVEHMEQPSSMDPPEAEIRIVADTGNDHHTERLQQELEPLIEREPTIPAGEAPATQMDELMNPEDRPAPDREQPPEQSDHEPAPPDAAEAPLPEAGDGREVHAETDGRQPEEAEDFMCERPAQDFMPASVGEPRGENEEALPELSPDEMNPPN